MAPPNEPPLADSVAGEILIQAAPIQGNSQDGPSQENTRALSSEMKAPQQSPDFWTFVHAFTEFYNEEKSEFSGLESSLTPLLIQDHVTFKFTLREDLMTNRNLNTIELLMSDIGQEENINIFQNKSKFKDDLAKIHQVT